MKKAPFCGRGPFSMGRLQPPAAHFAGAKFAPARTFGGREVVGAKSAFLRFPLSGKTADTPLRLLSPRKPPCWVCAGPHRLPRTCRGKKRIRPYSRPRARWRVQAFSPQAKTLAQGEFISPEQVDLWGPRRACPLGRELCEAFSAGRLRILFKKTIPIGGLL